MSTLEFKGKQHIYAHYLTVSYRLTRSRKSPCIYARFAIFMEIICFFPNRHVGSLEKMRFYSKVEK